MSFFENTCQCPVCREDSERKETRKREAWTAKERELAYHYGSKFDPLSVPMSNVPTIKERTWGQEMDEQSRRRAIAAVQEINVSRAFEEKRAAVRRRETQQSSAVARAPAVSPRVMVFCQSQYDPDE